MRCERYFQRLRYTLVPPIARAYSIIFPTTMRVAPTTSGGDAGFVAEYPTVKSVVVYQDNLGYQDLVFDARL